MPNYISQKQAFVQRPHFAPVIRHLTNQYLYWLYFLSRMVEIDENKRYEAYRKAIRFVFLELYHREPTPRERNTIWRNKLAAPEGERTEEQQLLFAKKWENSLRRHLEQYPYSDAYPDYLVKYLSSFQSWEVINALKKPLGLLQHITTAADFRYLIAIVRTALVTAEPLPKLPLEQALEWLQEQAAFLTNLERETAPNDLDPLHIKNRHKAWFADVFLGFLRKATLQDILTLLRVKYKPYLVDPDDWRMLVQVTEQGLIVTPDDTNLQKTIAWISARVAYLEDPAMVECIVGPDSQVRFCTAGQAFLVLATSEGEWTRRPQLLPLEYRADRARLRASLHDADKALLHEVDAESDIHLQQAVGTVAIVPPEKKIKPVKNIWRNGYSYDKLVQLLEQLRLIEKVSDKWQSTDEATQQAWVGVTQALVKQRRIDKNMAGIARVYNSFDEVVSDRLLQRDYNSKSEVAHDYFTRALAFIGS